MFHWTFLALSTTFALAALGISFWRLKTPVRALRDIELQLGDIEHDLESQRSTIRRLNARVGMREARDKKTPANGVDEETSGTAQLPGESPEEWKRRARLALRTGNLGK